MKSIGELSSATGCPVVTIRHYERVGLLPESQRSSGGHRIYTRKHERWLGFVVKARSLGFTLDNIRELLSLSEEAERSCEEAHKLVETNLTLVNEKLAELQRMKESLLEMSRSCKTSYPETKTPDYTIVDALYHEQNKQ